MTTTSTDRRIEARNVSVTFGDATVVTAVDLDVDRGEIVGLLGANGSGKSTLVKVLTGVYRPDRGTRVSVNGTSVSADAYGPLAARSLGVRVVHQEAPVIPTMTVAEMVGLQMGFPTRGGLVRQARLRAEAREVLGACDVDVDPDRLAGTLTAAERAMVSFAVVVADVDPARAVLVLDEATASLSTTDTERFLTRVRAAADAGLAVLMVTHRMAEVREHCDRTVVLRNGEVVDERASAAFDERAVVHAMVGDHPEADRAAARRTEVVPAPYGDMRLRVDALAGPGLAGATFALAPGEILGVTGRTDGGASPLLRIVAGIDPRTRGTVVLNGTETLPAGPRAAVQAGITYLSADRLSEGGIPTMTVAENLVLPRIERFGPFGSRWGDAVEETMRLLDVRPPDPQASFGTLSGGNQQKVLLGRWLLLDPRVLVLDDPTAGVDPHTREIIFETLRHLADEGLSILIRSTEPEQLARLCRRVLVMRGGRVHSVLEGTAVNTEEISLATYA